MLFDITLCILCYYRYSLLLSVFSVFPVFFLFPVFSAILTLLLALGSAPMPEIATDQLIDKSATLHTEIGQGNENISIEKSDNNIKEEQMSKRKPVNFRTEILK